MNGSEGLSLINQFLNELVDQGKTPGVQYASVDADGRVHSSSAGWADLHQQRPMSVTTAMMGYSMSKVVTAEAIARLEREKLLRFADRVVHHLPEFPYGREVTIQHLLEHKSGAPNPLPLRWVHLAADHERFDEALALKDVLRGHPAPKFASGSRTLYSNIGYWLLGRVVERVTDRSFVSYVEQQLLRTLGIQPAEIAYRFPVGGPHASGYMERYSLLNLIRPLVTDKNLAAEYHGRWLRIQDHYVNGPAFGGCIGTATGFCRFARYLIESGRTRFGWSHGSTYLQKEGGGAGFRCLLRLDLGHQRASAIMTNSTRLNVAACLDRIDELSGWSRGSDVTVDHPPSRARPAEACRGDASKTDFSVC